MDPEKWYKAQCDRQIQIGNVKATLYRRGAKVTGWPSRWPEASGRQKGKRGIIRSMSIRSMIRAAWQITNSPADFDLMTVLTFRDSHPSPKACLRAWCLEMMLNTPAETPWGWATEFQERGIVHYHIIHTTAHLRVTHPERGLRWHQVTRKGRKKSVLQGWLGRYMQDAWIRLVGDTSSEFLRFQRGGITERMEKPELTGLYLGGYVGKRAQKILPDFEPPQGRWWWLSPSARPIAGQVARLTSWPHEKAHHLVHDHSALINHLDFDISTPDRSI